MDILLIIGKTILVALAVVGVALPLINQRHEYHYVWQVYKRFRLGLFFQAFGVLVAVMIVAVTLMKVPGLHYGWIQIFYEETGNASIKPILEASKSSNELVRLLPIIFFMAFLFASPFLARAEEKMFREGYREWPEILWQSVKFGLVHCIVGIPLAFGLALSIGGLFFGYKYKRAYDRTMKQTGQHILSRDEALMASTVAHTMYNSILITFLLIVAIVAL